MCECTCACVCACVHALPVFPCLCNVSLVVPLFCLGPSLVQCERKAWEDVKGNGESHPFQGLERGAGGGGGDAQKESQRDGSLPLNAGSGPRRGRG